MSFGVKDVFKYFLSVCLSMGILLVTLLLYFNFAIFGFFGTLLIDISAIVIAGSTDDQCFSRYNDAQDNNNSTDSTIKSFQHRNIQARRALEQSSNQLPLLSNKPDKRDDRNKQNASNNPGLTSPMSMKKRPEVRVISQPHRSLFVLYEEVPSLNSDWCDPIQDFSQLSFSIHKLSTIMEK